MTLFTGARGKLNAFNSQLHQNLHNGPQHEGGNVNFEQARDEEKRDVVEKSCQVLEGSLYHAAFSVLSLLVSSTMLALGALSPLENSTWCQGFFMILTGMFVVNQSFFLVKRVRDSAMLPKLDREFHPSPEYYFLTRMEPHQWHHTFGPGDHNDDHLPKLDTLPLLKKPSDKKVAMDAPIQVSVWARKLLNNEPLFARDPTEPKKLRVTKKGCLTCGHNPTGDGVGIVNCHACNGSGTDPACQCRTCVPSNPGKLPCQCYVNSKEFCHGWRLGNFDLEIWGVFLLSTGALIVSILCMDVALHTKFFYVLVSVYLTCSSLDAALTFRDRMAARIYRQYLRDAMRAGDKICTYIMTNILRAIEASKEPAKLFAVIAFVAAVFTILALLCPSEDATTGAYRFTPDAIKDRVLTPGFWMVFIGLPMIFALLCMLDWYSQNRKRDELDLKDEFVLGWFGGMFPVIGIFVVAIVLAFVAVLTMGINLTEKAAIVCGVLVFTDSTFNYFRFANRTEECKKLWKRWDRKYGAGERHMKIDCGEVLGVTEEEIKHGHP